ncbi:MAPEG family protein [Novosphingobium sp.]|uniref:MAPEG family protein n=1 Tax=Novosphingobium sp. TaxID=1874826 RepID=UPI002B483259|nr:MAPEG family protein [Novosphingobium sp.]HKR92869.1 MAPEG family protein [Novosphingobium sp.]
MVGMAILQPVVALAAWTMVMWFWLYGTRIPALSAAKVDPEELVNDPKLTLDNILPPQVQWKAHNYNHLHEAPTVFYAVAIVLAVIGQGDGLNAQIGWVYVVLRVIHSLIQATVNKVTLRFAIFALSSFCLMFLVARAALAMF